MTDIREVVNAYKEAKTQRLELEDTYREMYEYSVPVLGMEFIGRQSQGMTNASSAKSFQGKVYDTTAPDAVDTRTNAILNGLTPRSSQWIEYEIPTLPAQDVAALEWLDQAGEIVWRSIHQGTNYDTEAKTSLTHFNIVGYCCLFVDWDSDARRLRFETWTPYNVYAKDCNNDGEVDTVYRTMYLTLKQAVATFGEEKLPEKLQRMYKRKPDDLQKHEFLHVIEPNEDYVEGSDVTANLQFKSRYICLEGDVVVEETGYYEFPVVFPRYSLFPNTDYAFGPFYRALPDVKTLNKIVEMELIGAEMNIAGVYKAKHDGIMNMNTVRIRPRTVIFMQDVDNLQPLTTATDYGWIQAEISRIRSQIRSVMKVDDLQPLDKPYASATEVSFAQAYSSQQLGPEFSLMEKQWIDPLVTRVFGLLMRNEVIPSPPPSIAGMEMVTRYVSPLARAQRRQEVDAMTLFEQAIATQASVFPDALDLYDWDEAARERAHLLGVPAKLLRSPDEVQEIREDQQALREQMMQMQAQGEIPQ